MEKKNISLNIKNKKEGKTPPKIELQHRNINIDSEILKTKDDVQKISKATILFNNNNFIDDIQSPERRQTINESNNTENIPYLKIDIKNKFTLSTERINKRINKILTRYKKNFSEQKSHIKNIVNKFLEIKFPKYSSNFFMISKEISKNIEKTAKLDLEFIETKINYFYKIRYDLQYLKYLKLTKEACINLGYILCFCYKYLSKYKIKDDKSMQNNINSIIKSKINVLNDYYSHCINNNLVPDREKKTKYWKENKDKYPLIPEMIFLINVFFNVDTIEIDMNIQGNILTEEEIQLFTISFFNLQFLFNQIDNVKVSFINETIQNILYGRYYEKLYLLTNNNQFTIKKNYTLNENIYEKKWDFEKSFILQDYKNVNIKPKKYHTLKTNKNDSMFFDENKKPEPIDDKDVILIKTKEAKNEFVDVEIVNDQLNKSNTIKEFSLNDFFSEKPRKKTVTIRNSYAINNSDQILYVLDNEEKSLNKNIFFKKEKFENLINKHIYIFEIILVVFISLETLEKFKSVEIILNDCYYREFINYLNKYCSINSSIINNNFHILDFLENNISKIENFFLEFNSLDPLTFEKFLVLLKINENEFLKKLKISFFSSDITYYQQSIFKNHFEYTYNFNILRGNSAGDTNERILNELLTNFINNINILFNLILSKNELNEIGFNFDLPEILFNKENYKIIILKFLLNILQNVSNKNNSKITKLTLLSSHTVLDERTLPNVKNIINTINLKEKNKNLKELSLHFKFYKIINIDKFICENLTVLNIGDLDLVTFKYLITYLTSYQFYQKSNLESISISLLKIFTTCNNEIKLLLRKLFTIKNKNLYSLNLFTNLIIMDRENYVDIIQLMNNGWIPNYTVTFHQKTENILNEHKKEINKLKFLVAHSLEENLLDTDEQKIKAKNKKNVKNANNEIDVVYWYLLYLFNHRYVDKTRNFFSKKCIIFTILKYIYFVKKPVVKHKLEAK